MPLIKNPSKEAFSSNVAAERNAGRPRAQALAIAYDIQRRAQRGMANGGVPWFVRNEARDVERYGMQHGATPGRADAKAFSAAPGSYIFPADVVSGMGQGNSMAGANTLGKMFKMGPYGSGASPMPHAGGRGMPGINKSSLGIRQKFAQGGEVPINISDGEFAVPPEHVAMVEGANGDVDLGHAICDRIVQLQRQKTIAHLQSLPPPRGSDAEQSSYSGGGGVMGVDPQIEEIAGIMQRQSNQAGQWLREAVDAPYYLDRRREMMPSYGEPSGYMPQPRMPTPRFEGYRP